jgi:hypothetical protein
MVAYDAMLPSRTSAVTSTAGAASSASTSVAPVDAAAKPQGGAIDFSVYPPVRPPVLHFAFQPVPFGRVSLPMRKPTVAPAVADDVTAVYDVINARASEADIDERRSSAVSTSANALDSRWLDSVRTRLWAAQDALLQRQQQVMRGMVGPAREKIVRQLGGSIIADEERATAAMMTAAGSHSARRPTTAEPARGGGGGAKAQAAGSAHAPSSSCSDAAATRALQKLEMFAKMRAAQKSAAQAPPDALADTADSAQPSLPRKNSTLLDRLRALDADMSATDASMARSISVAAPSSVRMPRPPTASNQPRVAATVGSNLRVLKHSSAAAHAVI